MNALPNWRAGIPAASQTDEAAAVDVFRGNWDAEGTASVHLPADTAIALLTLRGWTAPAFRRDGAWMSPNGTRIFGTAEALQVALTAEGLGLQAALAGVQS